MTLLIRTQQHWLPRCVDVLLTVIAWIGFVGLVYAGIREMADAVPLEQRLIESEILMSTLETLLVYLLGGVLIAALLLFWAKYNQLRARRYTRRQCPGRLCVDGLSGSFRVAPEVIETLHGGQVWILHHHEHGDLSAIEMPGKGIVLTADAQQQTAGDTGR
ncbi:poly-beta-1,6-N-acetyl-D-glucosamine biosynthesis protein PgaD [Pseudomonas sp. NCCP-436]|uniref:poly-beta-1,6-N-acetyl-D-glucosamine biosynthesis protein PgaD n=1 Tax=Pseudomonas sp. NCCP-436 TaxID=2842481 RepID=UPI001C7F99F9|nr:poly-beta-1,6-N-acetyl-D-glucosamine biosynthesis protein PgaD [Pseudomonas sp. NCCP-436]GIZ12640.1 poly-beta-1,6-N-acetyl-D-glucosamine biosynthesis protein PgaD [Pseudomonas sp. NCCP-436]